MNKDALIKIVSKDTGYTQKDINIVVDSIFNNIMDIVKSGDNVNIVGFGKFEARTRSERNGVNPQTGESITIPKCTSPAFKPGSTFKSLLK